MADYYASSGGSAGGDGSLGDPWDLATAFAATATVGAGDTLWLMEQSYTGRFTVALSGTDDANRVEVRPYDGFVVIDMVGSAGNGSDQGMVVTGDFIDLWDIWVTSSNEDRWQDQEDGGLSILGDEVRVFFGGVYDTGNTGVSWFSSSEGGLVHGLTVFSNGYDDTDRGHGPGVYTQNNGASRKTIDLCAFGFQMSPQAIQAYTEGGTILNYLIKRNVAPQRVLLGGYTAVDDGEVDANHVLAGSLQVGFSAGVTNETALVTDNVTPTGSVTQIGTWNALTVSGTVNGSTRNAVDVIASEHDNDRALVVVYDADGDGVVAVDLTGLSLTAGTEYVLAHYLNPLAEGYTFTWDGESLVYVRTDAAWTVAAPLGHDAADEGSQVPLPVGSAPTNRMAFVLAPASRWPASLSVPNAPSLAGGSVSTPTLDTATMWSTPSHRENDGDFTDRTGNGRHTLIRSNWIAGGDATKDPVMGEDETHGIYARLYNGSNPCPIVFPHDAAWEPDNRSFTVLGRIRSFAQGANRQYLFGNFSGTPRWAVYLDDIGSDPIVMTVHDGTTEVTASLNSWWVPKLGELWEYMFTWSNAAGTGTLYVCEPGGLPTQLLTDTDAALIGADIQPATAYSTAMAAINLVVGGAGDGSYNASSRLDWFGWAKFAGTILTPAQGQTAFAEMAAANTASASRRGLPGHRAPWIGVGIGV